MQAFAFRYLQDEQHLALSPKSVQVGFLSPEGHMQIDSVSIESLELVKAIRTGRGSAHKCDSLFRCTEAVETGRSSAFKCDSLLRSAVAISLGGGQCPSVGSLLRRCATYQSSVLHAPWVNSWKATCLPATVTAAR